MSYPALTLYCLTRLVSPVDRNCRSGCHFPADRDRPHRRTRTSWKVSVAR